MKYVITCDKKESDFQIIFPFQFPPVNLGSKENCGCNNIAEENYAFPGLLIYQLLCLKLLRTVNIRINRFYTDMVFKKN